MARLKRTLKEIHRRYVWQALLFYLILSWSVYYVSQSIAARQSLPEWFTEFTIVLLIIGLPVVLITAAVQEGIPKLGRSDPTLHVDLDDADAVTLDVRPRAPGVWRLFSWRNAILGGLVAFTIWAIVALAWLALAERLVLDAKETAAEEAVVGGEE